MTGINEIVDSGSRTKQYTTVSLGATIQGCVYSRDGTAADPLSSGCPTPCNTGSCDTAGSAALPGAITNNVCGGGYQSGESECLLINLVAPVNKPDDVSAMSVRSNDGDDIDLNWDNTNFNGGDDEDSYVFQACVVGGGDCVDDVTWPSTGQGVNSGCPPVGDCYYWRETSWSTSGTNHYKTNFQTSDSRDSGNSATHTKLIPRARYAWKVAPVNSAVDACSASDQSGCGFSDLPVLLTETMGIYDPNVLAAAPTGTGVTDTSMSWSWITPTNNGCTITSAQVRCTGTDVYGNPASSPWVNPTTKTIYEADGLNPTPGQTSTYTWDDGLAPGIRYQCNVRNLCSDSQSAGNGIADSYGSSGYQTTTRSEPGAVGSLSYTATTDHPGDTEKAQFNGPAEQQSVVLTWMDPMPNGYAISKFEYELTNLDTGVMVATSDTCASAGSCDSSYNSAVSTAGGSDDAKALVTPDARMLFRVRPVSGGFETPPDELYGPWANISFRMDAIVPGQPTPTLAAFTPDTATFEWSEPALNGGEITQYWYKWGGTSVAPAYPFAAPAGYGFAPYTGSCYDKSGTTTCNITFTGLVDGAEYRLNLLASNYKGNCTDTNSPYIYNVEDVPAKPIVTDQTATTMTISWADYTDSQGNAATNHRVFNGTSGDATSIMWLETGSGTSSATLTGLVRDTSYTWYIQAFTALTASGSWTGDSPSSDPALTDGSAPGAPGAPIASAIAARSMAVGWTAPTDDGGRNITGYVLTVSSTVSPYSPASPYSDTVRTLGNVTEATLTGLLPHANYTMSVAAINSVSDPGTGASSAEATALTADDAAEAPLAPTVLSETSSSVTLAINESTVKPRDGWLNQAAGTPRTVNYYRTTWNSTNFHLLGDAEAPATPVAAETDAASDFISAGLAVPGLVPGMPYTFQVAVQTDVDGTPTWSDYSPPSASPVYCTPTEPRTPAAPVDGVVDPAVSHPSRGRNVRWTKPWWNGADITSYEVNSTTPSGLVPVSSCTSTGGDPQTCEQFFGTLEPKTSYFFSVRAYNTEGWSEWSNVSELVTDTDVPDKVPPLVPQTAETTYPDKVRIAWSAPPSNGLNITRYEILEDGLSFTGSVFTPNDLSQTSFVYELARNPPHSKKYKIRAYNSDGWGEYSDEETYYLENALNTPEQPDPPLATMVYFSNLTVASSTPTPDHSQECRYPSLNCTEITYTLTLSPDTPGGSPYAVNTTIGANWTRPLGGLTPNTNYTMTLVATNAEGATASEEVTFVTAISVAEATADLAKTAVTRTNATMGWSKPHDNGAAINRYRVQACVYDYVTAAATATCLAYQEQLESGATESYTYTGLTAGTNYTISVEAYNSEGWGAPAYVEPVTTRDVPLQVTTVGDGGDVNGLEPATSLHAAWSAPFDNDVQITSYRVKLDCEPDPGYVGGQGCESYDPSNGELADFVEAATGGNTDRCEIVSVANESEGVTLQFIKGSLIPGTEHIVMVEAYNAEGYGPQSQLYCMTTDKAPPGKPNPPTVTQLADPTDVQVDVNPAPYDGGGTILQYQLRVDVTDTSSVVTQFYYNISTADMNHTFTEKDSNKNHKFYTRAENYLGWGDWSDAAQLDAGGGFASAPDYVNVTDAAPEVVTLAFEMPYSDDGITRYNVELVEVVSTYNATSGACEDATTTVTRGVTLPGGTDPGCSTGCTGTVDGLLPDTSYRVRLAGINSAGTGAYSTCTADYGPCSGTYSAFESGHTAPAAVTGLMANLSADSATTASLTWAVPDANGEALEPYDVVVTRAPDDTDAPACASAATSTAMTAPTTPVTGGDECDGGKGGSRTFSLSGLVAGCSYTVNVTAKNALGSSDGQVVAFHTYAEPNAPQQPTISPTASLDEKRGALVLEWEAPSAHGLPIREYELEYSSPEDGGEPIIVTVDGSMTTHTIANLSAASVYEVRIRARNDVNWGEWTAADYLLWTDPDVPDPPYLISEDGLSTTQQGLLCASYAPTSNPRGEDDDSNAVSLVLGTVEGNGLGVQHYQLQAVHAGWALDSSGNPTRTPVGCSAAAITATCANSSFTDAGNCSLESAYGDTQVPVFGLLPDTPYCYRVRAKNALGYGEWADFVQCTTEVEYEDPFQLWWVLVPILACTCICLAGGFYKYYQRKVVPRLKKKSEDNIDHYISRNDAPMEDDDPEIVMNPVLVAKLQAQKNAAMGRKGQKQKGVGGGTKTGGLARLGFSKAEKELGKTQEKSKAVQLDDLVKTATGDEEEGGLRTAGMANPKSPAPSRGNLKGQQSGYAGTPRDDDMRAAL